MKNRKSVMLLGLAISLVCLPAALARDGGGGERGGGDRGGYPIGTQSSSQYAGALSEKSDYDGRMFNHGNGRSWWGGAVGGAGYGYGYGDGGGYGMPFTPNNGGYPLPDGCAAYNPIPVAPSDPALPIKDLHQDGPSMSFKSDVPDQNSNFQMPDDSWINSIPYAGGSGSSTGTSVNYSASGNSANSDGTFVSNSGRNFKVPAVQRGITAKLASNSTGRINNGVAATELTRPVTDALTSTKQLFEDARDAGRLGTLELEDFQKRLDALSESVNDYVRAPGLHSEDESGELTNMINKLADDIRMSNN